MRNRCKWIVGLLLVLLTAAPLWAKERYSVAVVPFATHSAENIDYIRLGVRDMLASRLSVHERLDVVGRDALARVLELTVQKEYPPADLQAAGKKMGADFVVWGTITKIGTSLSIDGRLLDVAAGKAVLNVTAQAATMDDVIPRMNDFSERIVMQILGVRPQAAAPPAPAQRELIVTRPPSPQTAREAQIISGMSGGKRGTFTSSINPDFINAAQPLDRKTFWKSQQFSTEFRGMDIGDVTGDGQNETVMIDANSVYVYRKQANEFRLVQKIPGKSYSYYVSVDVADINRNGVREIIVSSYSGTQMDSFVLEYRNGKFERIASDLPWFMRVIDHGSGQPLLIGQRRGLNDPFDTPIHEIVSRSGSYSEGPRMRIPQGLSVYGLTIDRLSPGGPERIIALDNNDYVNIYEQTDKPLSKVVIFGGSNEFIWRSQEQYGGSNTYVEPVIKPSDNSEDADKLYFINLRILTFDTNNDGKREVILVKNLSSSARLFQRLKLFQAAEVYNLEWENLGMVENWHTRKINGYVADYQFKDIDNSGEKKIVLALVLSTGAALSNRSVIVTYSLKGE